MLLTLTVSLDGSDDFPLITGVRKLSGGSEVTFEGSYRFQGDRVTHGMPLVDGERVRVRLSLLPSATRLRAGDEIRLDIQGHWFHHRDPVHGQFPVGYHTDAKGRCTLHLGPEDEATLSIPVLPAASPGGR